MIRILYDGICTCLPGNDCIQYYHIMILDTILHATSKAMYYMYALITDTICVTINQWQYIGMRSDNI
jgi:hypothetical protein